MDDTQQRNQPHGRQGEMARTVPVHYASLGSDAREMTRDAATAGSSIHSCPIRKCAACLPHPAASRLKSRRFRLLTQSHDAAASATLWLPSSSAREYPLVSRRFSRLSRARLSGLGT
jgi:hypothetical protein